MKLMISVIGHEGTIRPRQLFHFDDVDVAIQELTETEAALPFGQWLEVRSEDPGVILDPRIHERF